MKQGIKEPKVQGARCKAWKLFLEPLTLDPLNLFIFKGAELMESTSGLTRTIARFITQVDTVSIPREDYEQAKVALLDWLAVLLAGKDEPLVTKLLRYGDLMGGNAQATILGHGQKTNVSQAALVNGAMSHALDYDDTMAQFQGHPIGDLVSRTCWPFPNGRRKAGPRCLVGLHYRP